MEPPAALLNAHSRGNGSAAGGVGAHQIHYASDENRSVSGVVADDESKYIYWAYVVQEALDKYIFDTYGKMASIGLLHYPDIAQIALNDLTPAEKEFGMRECDSDDDEMVDQDLLAVCTMTTTRDEPHVGTHICARPLTYAISKCYVLVSYPVS